MGYRAGVLSETEDAPAAQVAHWTVIGRADHLPALRAFCRAGRGGHRRVRERLGPRAALAGPPAAGAARLADASGSARTGSARRRFLARHGIPHAPWRPVRDRGRARRRRPGTRAAADPQDGRLGLRRQGAGPGRPRPTTRPAPGPAWAGRRASPRGGSSSPPRSRSSWPAAHDGHAVCYPVGLNRHERHILDTHDRCPRPVGPIVTQEARDLALAVAQALGTVGVLTVEFFLTADGRLLVNEIAPRPHNSGHLTIEAAVASQFEQQVRALCGLPLGATDLVMPAAMVNLLGDLWTLAGGEPHWDAALGRDPGV